MIIYIIFDGIKLKRELFYIRNFKKKIKIIRAAYIYIYIYIHIIYIYIYNIKNLKSSPSPQKYECI